MERLEWRDYSTVFFISFRQNTGTWHADVHRTARRHRWKAEGRAYAQHRATIRLVFFRKQIPKVDHFIPLPVDNFCQFTTKLIHSSKYRVGSERTDSSRTLCLWPVETDMQSRLDRHKNFCFLYILFKLHVLQWRAMI